MFPFLKKLSTIIKEHYANSCTFKITSLVNVPWHYLRKYGNWNLVEVFQRQRCLFQCVPRLCTFKECLQIANLDCKIFTNSRWWTWNAPIAMTKLSSLGLLMSVQKLLELTRFGKLLLNKYTLAMYNLSFYTHFFFSLC